MRIVFIAAGILTALLIGGYVAYSMPRTEPESAFALTPIQVRSDAPSSPALPKGWKEYKSGRFNYTFAYPAELVMTEKVDTATSRSILFENKTGTKSFQIYIVAYKGETITDEQFLNDSPLGVRDEPQALQVGGVSAVHFLGKDVNLGPTAEVWFIHRGHLFEVATVRELDAWLMEILGTWRFL